MLKQKQTLVFPYNRSSVGEKPCFVQTGINHNIYFHMDTSHLKFHPTTKGLKTADWIICVVFPCKIWWPRIKMEMGDKLKITIWKIHNQQVMKTALINRVFAVF